MTSLYVGALGKAVAWRLFALPTALITALPGPKNFRTDQKKNHITYPKTKPSTPDQALPVRPCRACRNDMHSSTVREVGVGQIAMHGVGNFYCYDIVHGVTPPGWSSYAISAFPFLLKKREHAPEAQSTRCVPSARLERHVILCMVVFPWRQSRCWHTRWELSDVTGVRILAGREHVLFNMS